MPIPSTSKDLTPSWFSSILNGIHVKPETFKINQNAQEGLGFLSMLVRAEFETETTESGKCYKDKYNLIVKLLPESSTFAAAVSEKGYDKAEINTYRYLVPDLVREISSLEKYVCPFYYGEIQEADSASQTPYASALVLADLRPLGYITKLYNEDLMESEFDQGIDFLATFHVATRSLEHRKGGTLPEIYHWFPNWISSVGDIRRGILPSTFSYSAASYEGVFKFLEQRNPAIIPHYEIVKARSKKIFQVTLLEAQKHPCGTHMDLWSHNMLVNTDHQKPVKIIDWQLLGYTDPMLDFGIYVLKTIPIESMNATGISRALKIYYKRSKELCEEKGVPLNRSFEEFNTFLMTYGLGFIMAWLPMFTPDFLLKVPGSEAKFLRFLEIFVELGLTDFLVSVT